VPDTPHDRLMEMQQAFMEKHKDADVIESYRAPPDGNGCVAWAVYFSPVYKVDELLRQFFQSVKDSEATK
jgi:hypothetical protein